MIFRWISLLFALLVFAGFVDLAAFDPASAASHTSRVDKKALKKRKAATVRGSMSMNDSGASLGGMKRIYHLYIPESCKGKKDLPLVLVFHGAMENGEVIRKITRMDEEAEKKGFIVVYPYGSGHFKGKYLCWNAFDCCGSAIRKKVDDVGFVSALIDRLSSEYSIDGKRVYACGYSNGAMFCYRLASELSSKLAAVAVVGGSMSGKEKAPANGISVLIIHGTDDRHVPYYGGTGKWAKWGYPVNRESVSYARSFWTNANRCKNEASISDEKDLKIESFQDADGRNEVKLITLKGARHTWPSGLRSLLYTDKPFNGLNASEECWKFFAAHPKSAEVVLCEDQTQRSAKESK